MKQFYAILTAGAFGGILSWLSTLVFGGPLERLAWPIAIAAGLLLGAGAAIVGVYIIANTDRSDLPRALAFGVLCGFSWQITYEAATSMIQRREARAEAQTTTQTLTKAVTQLASHPQSASLPAVNSLVSDTKTALRAAKQANSEEASGAAVQASMQSIDTLHKVQTPQSTAETTTGVEAIATTALETGHEEVAKKAVDTLALEPLTPESREALTGIAATAERQNAPLVRDAARKALAAHTDLPIGIPTKG